MCVCIAHACVRACVRACMHTCVCVCVYVRVGGWVSEWARVCVRACVWGEGGGGSCVWGGVGGWVSGARARTHTVAFAHGQVATCLYLPHFVVAAVVGPVTGSLLGFKGLGFGSRRGVL